MIKNPCKGICKMSFEHKVCIGCYRTSSERTTWATMTDEEKTRSLRIMKMRELQLGPLSQPKQGEIFRVTIGG